MRLSTRKYLTGHVRKRNKLELKGIAMAKAALVGMYSDMIGHLKNADRETWPELIEAMGEAPVKNFMYKFYPLFSPMAYDMRNHVMNGKSAEAETFYLNFFSKRLQQILSEHAGEKIKSIVMTSKARMLAKIREIESSAELEGLGVEVIKQKIIDQLGTFIVGDAEVRARAIAQTETISASNTASFLGAKSTGLTLRKFWLTSGLPNTRDSHLEMQAYSEKVNGLPQDEAYPNGLMHPGDMDGVAEEVINCRCTGLYEPA